MHGTTVKRVLGIVDAEESGTLLIGRGSETRNFLQLCARGEGAILLAVIHDVLCKGRAESADICKEVYAGCVEVNAYGIHATLNRTVKGCLELSLVHIMLILSYADALRVNLYEFGKRVHESSADTHGTTYGYILVRELIACSL
jgi:hypothetical protein